MVSSKDMAIDLSTDAGTILVLKFEYEEVFVHQKYVYQATVFFRY